MRWRDVFSPVLTCMMRSGDALFEWKGEQGSD